MGWYSILALPWPASNYTATSFVSVTGPVFTLHSVCKRRNVRSNFACSSRCYSVLMSFIALQIVVMGENVCLSQSHRQVVKPVVVV